jgi:protocatechuate 3,4-dioxygenase beta subunit
VAITAAQVLPPTPQCSSKAAVTIAETEGPYFKPSSPLRTSLLEASISGTKLIVTGYVLSTSCQPVKNALLDFWQADANGQYDNQGFKMRGHQFTDDTGKFTLETVIPGLYPGRTRHIHVKVQAPNQAILTTQLFFPGEPRNQTDGIFHQSLLMQMQDIANSAKQGNFNFVLSI